MNYHRNHALSPVHLTWRLPLSIEVIGYELKTASCESDTSIEVIRYELATVSCACHDSSASKVRASNKSSNLSMLRATEALAAFHGPVSVLPIHE